MEDITLTRPVCDHDYVLVSCLPGSKQGRMDVRAACSRCGHEREIKDAWLTGMDYGEPTEGIVVQKVEMVPVPADDDFADWMRGVLEDEWMGQVKIELVGSFDEARIRERRSPQSFSAQDRGHAAAVARAIAWLADVVMPAAIALDHDLHEAGEQPTRPFGMGD